MEWKDSLHPLDSSGAGSLSEVQENFSGQEETQLFLIESRTNCPVTKRVLLLWNSKNRERGRERVWKIKQMKVSYECSQPVFILYPLSAATKSYLMQMQCCLLLLFSPHFHCTSACPSTFCIANINIILKHHPRLSLHVSLDSQTRKYFQPWLSFFFSHPQDWHQKTHIIHIIPENTRLHTRQTWMFSFKFTSCLFPEAVLCNLSAWCFTGINE